MTGYALSFFLFPLWVTVVFVGAVDAGNDPTENPGLAVAIRDLRAAEAAWRRNDAEFRELRKQGQVSETEVREYAEFVAGLRRQVFEGCETVRRLGGDTSQHGVDCIQFFDEPAGANGGDLANSGNPANFGSGAKNGNNGNTLNGVDAFNGTGAVDGTTREDRIASLKNELEKLESDFDGMILKEQNQLRGRRAAAQSSGGWKSGTNDTFISETNKTVNGGAATAQGTAGPASAEGLGSVEGSASQGELAQQEYEPGAGPGVDKGKLPDFQRGGGGDSSDDDVVARQLREAAEIETDPLLKEQLWKEYKKYKKSLR